MVLLLFLVIFAMVALLLVLMFGGRGDESKQVLTRVDSLRPGPQAPDADDMLIVRRKDALSNIPWLDRWLQNLDLAPKLRLLLYQAEMTWTPARLLLTAILLGMIFSWIVYLRTDNILMAFTFLVMGGALPFLNVLRKRNNRFDRLKQRLPEALDMMVAAIRAGHSFTSALGMVSRESPEPVRREFRQCYDEQNFGLDLRHAMVNLGYRVPTRDIRMITAAVLIQKETGGNLTEILEKVSILIREDFRLQRQVQVHTAQGRLTGWILSLLPLVLGVAMYMVNPKQMSILWERPVGLKMLWGAAVMTSIGGLIIRKIIRIQI